MSIKILISGPRGGGKSTIVRQVMSLYSRSEMLSGGVGGLPRGYRLLRINHIPEGEGWSREQECGRLLVLGNYSTRLRDRFGMGVFDRYREDFLAALDYANRQPSPALCEGGFLHTKRIDTDQVREFCKELTIVWLTPSDAAKCDVRHRRVDYGDVSRSNYERRAADVVNKLMKLGAEICEFTDREKTLRLVTEQISQQLDHTRCLSYDAMTDYR